MSKIYSNLFILFLVVKVKHMLGVDLAGAWRAVRWRSGSEVERKRCLYIIKTSIYSISFSEES